MKHLAMWACAMATFAGPISWALFFSSDDAQKPVSVAEGGCAKCPGPAANSTEAEASYRDASPWDELGTTNNRYYGDMRRVHHLPTQGACTSLRRHLATIAL